MITSYHLKNDDVMFYTERGDRQVNPELFLHTMQEELMGDLDMQESLETKKYQSHQRHPH